MNLPALGKPGGADLSLGLATGPALYAWEEHPEMGEEIQKSRGCRDSMFSFPFFYMKS